MENRLNNIDKFTSSLDPQIKASPSYKYNQGDYVFWIVNLKELFNIDINYPGIKSALNKAFNESKRYVPVDTGLTKRSMTQRILDNYTVEIFFDPKKIIGKKRNGVIIKENYTIYIAESPKRFNWISICMYHYYDALFNAVKQLAKKKSPNKTKEVIAMTAGLTFFSQLKQSYKAKKEEAKRLQEQEKEKKKILEDQIKEKKRLMKLKNDTLADLEDQEDK